jgi:molybdopterin-guanine dinucleotide biosynthesis protein A
LDRLDEWDGSGDGPAAAVILAGGGGRRLGGQDKPGLRVGGRTLLEIVLRAVGNCPVVVVGPPRTLPPGVMAASEEPPGGGPAAAVAAGVRALPVLPADALVALLAADLPGITDKSIGRLCAALQAADSHPLRTLKSVGPEQQSAAGAVLLDPVGRRQYLVGVWRFGVLTEAIDRRGNWHGVALRELLLPIRTIDIAGSDRETADVDTPADWQRWQS